jgi:hypothetical protein
MTNNDIVVIALLFTAIAVILFFQKPQKFR